MLRRACYLVLALVLLAPALPVLANDGGWQIPDLGAWLLGLIHLEPDPLTFSKSSSGVSDVEAPPEDPADSTQEPAEEGGIFIDPSG